MWSDSSLEEDHDQTPQATLVQDAYWRNGSFRLQIALENVVDNGQKGIVELL